MTISLTNFCQSCSLKLGNIYVFSLDIALISILISVFFFFVHTHTWQKKYKNKNKTLYFLFSQSIFSIQPLCIFILWHYYKTSRLYLGVSVTHREPLTHIIKQKFSLE